MEESMDQDLLSLLGFLLRYQSHNTLPLFIFKYTHASQKQMDAIYFSFFIFKWIQQQQPLKATDL